MSLSSNLRNLASMLLSLYLLTAVAEPQAKPSGPQLFPHTVGVDAHVGLNGIGFDVAAPVARRFDVRIGADFFGYSTSFEDDGADVNVNLHMQTAKAALDWFPFGNGFRVSPLLIFANNNRVRGTTLIPSGRTVTLDGSDYISSPTDPLHGSGSVDLRKVAPGLSVGWGNIVPKAPKHLSFPVEVGFYYVGQPRLKVAFTGSSCSIGPDSGCESVDHDPSFQQSLTAFRNRNNNNLSYASFFPIVSFGVGYRF